MSSFVDIIAKQHKADAMKYYGGLFHDPFYDTANTKLVDNNVSIFVFTGELQWLEQ